jgi:hypothetical protein
MALEKGNWFINANGSVGQLQITNVDNNGNLRGNVFGFDILGFWDDPLQKIMFIGIQPAPIRGFPDTTLIFTGYQFRGSIESGSRGVPTAYTLAGSFEALPMGENASLRRPQRRLLYGWVAYIRIQFQLDRPLYYFEESVEAS